MPLYYHFPFLTILCPMLAAFIIPLVRKKGISRQITLVSFFVAAILSLLIVYNIEIDGVGSFLYKMGKYPAPWGNELRASTIEAFLAFILVVISFFSLTGSESLIKKDVRQEKEYIYYMLLNVIIASIFALIYTNDLFTAYVFIEINAITACGIVSINTDGESLIATIKYFVMSAVGSGLYLFAVSTIYGVTGHLSMEFAGNAINVLVQEGTQNIPLIASLILIVIALGIKSAMFPFHSWLPDAHGSAATSSSSILSAVVLKAYVILIIKIIYRVYGVENIHTLGIFPVLFMLGFAGMVVASIFALKQKNLKKLIAFSSIAQIGYIYLALGVGTELGTVAAIFHILVHGITKAMLFISAGHLIKSAGSKKISDLRGIGRKNMLASVAFCVGGLSMIGIPLLAGFVTKLLFAGASQVGGPMAMAIIFGLAVSALLNALYYLPVMLSLFSKDGAVKATVEPKLLSGSEKFTLAAFILCNVAVGIFFSPIVELITNGIKHLV